MSDTLITIIGIFLAATLMFVFPLMAVSNTQDDISQIAVQTLVSEFVDTTATKGKITKTAYEEFEQKLYATGNSYDIEIEHKIMDVNPGKKSATGSGDAVGENIYYSVFNSTILGETDGVYSDKGEYSLKKGDYIILSVKNTNETIASQIKNFVYSIVGKDTYTIGASASAMVVNTGK